MVKNVRKYDDYVNDFINIKSTDDVAKFGADILAHIKEDLTEADTIKASVDEATKTINDLRETNMKLFLSQVKPQEHKDEEPKQRTLQDLAKEM